MMYILFMFVLEFKPQFLNYPLDPHEYARVTHRAKDASADLAHLQGEIESLQSHPEYVSLHVDSRERLAPYVGRLRDRAAVLKEELK